MTDFFNPLRLPMVFLLLGLTAIVPLSLAQNKAPDTTQTLTALLDDFLAGASINDRAAHDRFWADELIYTSSSGARFGKAAILSGLESGTPDEEPLPQYSASQVQVQDFGELAVVTFRLLAHLDGELTDQYFNTGVFRFSEAGWRAVTWHATRIPPEFADQ